MAATRSIRSSSFSKAPPPDLSLQPLFRPFRMKGLQLAPQRSAEVRRVGRRLLEALLGRERAERLDDLLVGQLHRDLAALAVHGAEHARSVVDPVHRASSGQDWLIPECR